LGSLLPTSSPFYLSSAMQIQRNSDVNDKEVHTVLKIVFGNVGHSRVTRCMPLYTNAACKSADDRHVTLSSNVGLVHGAWVAVGIRAEFLREFFWEFSQTFSVFMLHYKTYRRASLVRSDS
jgi:hypothetical protein